MKPYRIFLLVALGATVSVQGQDNNVSILTGIPTRSASSGWSLSGACCENCLCHGIDIYRLTIRNVRVLAGAPLPKSIEAEILEGFLAYGGTASQANRHLFVVRHKAPQSREDGLPDYIVVEGDGIAHGRACSWERLEDYLAGTAPFLSWAAMDRFRVAEDRDPYCYRVSDISELDGGQP